MSIKTDKTNKTNKEREESFKPPGRGINPGGRKVNRVKLLKMLKDAEDDKKEDVAKEIILKLCTTIDRMESSRSKKEGWVDVKRKFFNTSDLMEKLLIIEDFIYKKKIYEEKTKKRMPMFPPFGLPPVVPNSKSKSNNTPNPMMNPLILSQMMNQGNDEKKEEINKIREIFDNINDISQRLISLEATSLEKAEELYGSKESTKYKAYVRDVYNDILLELTGILSNVYEVYMSLKTKRKDEKTAFKRLIEMYDKAIKAHQSGVQVETGIGGAMENMFHKYSVDAGLTQEGQVNKQKLNNMNR